MTKDEHDLVDALVEQLKDSRRAVSPIDFPADAVMADRPGLYAWWADDAGLTALAAPFGVTLPALIYAGQAGATSTRSNTERSATLRSRIGGNHVNGNISSSTFRKTLSSLLMDPLDLRLAGTGRLDSASNRKVSTWMQTHLRVSIAAVENRASLADIEHAVLQRLDPPLNLMGMRPTPIRAELRRLRSALKLEREPRGSAMEAPSAVLSTASARQQGGRLTLHEAMVEVLQAVDWLTFRELADQIESRGLYMKGNGGPAGSGQLRMRATLSGGRYAHLFQVDGDRIRLSRS